MALSELMAAFAGAGGEIYVCAPCYTKRGLDADKLVDGAVIVGGAKLVEFPRRRHPLHLLLVSLAVIDC